VLLDQTGAYRTMNRRHTDFMRLAYPDGHQGVAGQLGHVFAPDGTTLLTREQMPAYRAAHGEEFDDCRIWVGEDPLSRRALSVSARSVRGKDGTFAGAALAYKDVTDFMRALQVKDEFVASVSHELRTPLTSIMGYVDLLLEDPDLQPEQASHLEVVSRNSDRLRRLVADLLHSAQIDEGPMHVVRTQTDLSAIVHQSLLTAAPVAKAAGIALDWDVPDTLPVLVDGQRISQVVDNLLSNAIKYTPEGGRVRVTLGVDGTRVELTVTDSGIGIAAPDRERLFTRFFRARPAEEQSIQGVGLGLSITKSIVESHGGRIEVESEPGRGSTFRVRLPREVHQQGLRAVRAG
jgi:signal transduction histidine kinase